MRRDTWIAASLLFITLTLAGGVIFSRYLFKVERMTLQGWGEIELRWRWGRAKVMLVDRNEDGIVDLRAIYSGLEREFYNHSAWVEYWLSRKCDGVFDVHFAQAGSGLVQIDSDADGRYDSQTSVDDLRLSLTQPPFSACWGTTDLSGPHKLH